MIHRKDSGEGEGKRSPTQTQAATSGNSATDNSAQPTTAMKAAMPSALMASLQPTPSAPAPAPVAPVAAPAKPVSKQVMNTNTLSPLARLRAGNLAPLPTTPAADAIKKFLETVKTTLDAKTPEYNIDIMPVNAKDSTVSLFASSIVFGVRLLNRLSDAMAYHVLLISDTADTTSRTDQLQGDNNLIVELPRVVGDAYDADYRAQVEAQLRATFPEVKTFLDAEASVLPAGYKYNDTSLVQRTLGNILGACGTILNTNVKDDFNDISIPELLSLGGGRMDTVAKLSFNNQNTSDAYGNPVRADIQVSYAMIHGQQQAKRGTIQSLNSGQQQTEIFKVTGFMDLLWRENPEYMGMQQNSFAAPFMPNMPNQNQMPWKYQARYVITGTDTTELATLPGQLLGLISSLVLQKNNNWMGAFVRSGANAAAAAHHDIGAIGIEVNSQGNPSGYGTPFDETKSATWTTQSLFNLLQAFVRPEIVTSIDVEECGASTWQNSIFVAATKNADANKMIIDAANLLTGGAFAKYWEGNRPVMVDDENRIHLGHFTTGQGQVLDLREIDHLTVLNMLGTSSPEQGRAWSDTFTDLRFDWPRRAEARLKIMKLISADVTVTGFARRVTFTNAFMDALSKAVVECGLVIRAETPFMEIAGTTRGQADFLAAATQGYGNNSALFNRGSTIGGGVQMGQQFGAGFGRFR